VTLETQTIVQSWWDLKLHCLLPTEASPYFIFNLVFQERFHGRFKDSDYKMSSHWATDFKANLFGISDPFFWAAQSRSALETDPLGDPPAGPPADPPQGASQSRSALERDPPVVGPLMDPTQRAVQGRSALEREPPQPSAFPAFAHACSQCQLSVPLFGSSI
jgi:hypothetical protein